MPTAETTAASAVTMSERTAIFVSLELSRSTWLMTALAAPLGSKMSRHQVRGGDMRGCWNGSLICSAMFGDGPARWSP